MSLKILSLLKQQPKEILSYDIILVIILTRYSLTYLEFYAYLERACLS